jgi:hypothetical protein
MKHALQSETMTKKHNQWLQDVSQTSTIKTEMLAAIKNKVRERSRIPNNMTNPSASGSTETAGSLPKGWKKYVNKDVCRQN